MLEKIARWTYRAVAVMHGHLLLVIARIIAKKISPRLDQAWSLYDWWNNPKRYIEHRGGIELGKSIDIAHADTTPEPEHPAPRRWAASHAEIAPLTRASCTPSANSTCSSSTFCARLRHERARMAGNRRVRAAGGPAPRPGIRGRRKEGGCRTKQSAHTAVCADAAPDRWRVGRTRCRG